MNPKQFTITLEDAGAKILRDLADSKNIPASRIINRLLIRSYSFLSSHSLEQVPDMEDGFNASSSLEVKTKLLDETFQEVIIANRRIRELEKKVQEQEELIDELGQGIKEVRQAMKNDRPSNG